MSTIRQGVSYCVIGAIQIFVDWLTFFLLSKAGLDPALANLSGRIVGAALGFRLNGTFTFSKDGQASVGRTQFLRYVVTWCLTSAASTVIVVGVHHFHGLAGAELVKPIGDAGLALVAFLFSKYWVYS